MEEGVGEVEEVAVLGVEEAVRQPVDRHRDEGDDEPDDGRPIEPRGHAAICRVSRRVRRRPGGPSRSPTRTSATSVTQNAIG